MEITLNFISQKVINNLLVIIVGIIKTGKKLFKTRLTYLSKITLGFFQPFLITPKNCKTSGFIR